MALDVVIPTLNAAGPLRATLESLAQGRDRGLVKRIIVSDGGSQDETVALAAAAGCVILTGRRGRGAQLRAGADAAVSAWILFLHADTILSRGWAQEAQGFMAAVDAEEEGDARADAAVFTFALDDASRWARVLEKLVNLRVSLFALPYGDQGLLISRELYDRVGGFRPLPLMEDVDFIRRIGRKRLRMLSSRAITSAERYRRAGYLRRMTRNMICLGMFFLGVPAERVAKFYG